ncbi:hypothetical protein BHE74_00034168 [Ensete ventricosum]|nr:hypothetical protein BHE74_00034168 [Ensete ventricosum]
MFVNGCMNQLLLLQIMAATKFENMVFPTQETPSPTHRRRTGRRERRRAASEGRKNRVSCLKCDIRSAPVDHRRHFWAACKSCHQERISRSSVSSGAGNSYLAGWEVRNDDGPRTSADEGVRGTVFFLAGPIQMVGTGSTVRCRKSCYDLRNDKRVASAARYRGRDSCDNSWIYIYSLKFGYSNHELVNFD